MQQVIQPKRYVKKSDLISGKKTKFGLKHQTTDNLSSLMDMNHG